jgi:hypothetical protein
VKRHVEQLERTLISGRGGEANARRASQEGRGGQLRQAVGQSVLALSPPQVQRLQQMLTTPQRALVHGALREVRSLLLDRDREG